MNASTHIWDGQTADILLLTSTNNAYSRGVTAGVGAYAARHGRWNVTPMLLPNDAPDFSQFDGVVSVTSNWLQELIDSGVPAVLTSSVAPDPRLPVIISENRAVGEMAARHLLERRLSHFVGVGPANSLMARDRLDGFEAVIHAAGFACKRQISSTGGHRGRNRPVNLEATDKWLQSLDRPVGLFAVTDELAHGLLRSCRRLQLPVPDDVAVVGVNNDEILAALTQPPLSSVILNGPGIGELAAATLDRLMAGEQLVPGTIRIPPLGVEVRQSTDLLAVDDPVAAAAFRYIHQNAHRPLDVGQVCEAVATSRRAMERRFKAEFGRTLLSEIRAAHIQRAQKLLLTTDQPIDAIAYLCGFRHAENFFAAFRRVTGTTPAAFRATGRPRPASAVVGSQQ